MIVQALRRVVVAGAVLAVSSVNAAAASPCAAPNWATVEVAHSLPSEGVVVHMQPLARMVVPPGYDVISSRPGGAIAFRWPGSSGMALTFNFESDDFARIHGRSSAYELYAAIFRALDPAGCKALAEGFELDKEDYRDRFVWSPDVEAYMYGRLDRHTFYLLDRKQPRFVLMGAFKNATKSQAQAVLRSFVVGQ